MRLKEYLHSAGLTQERFAQLVGVHKNTINLICGGKIYAGPGLATKIEKCTRGRVKAVDVMRGVCFCPTCGRRLTAAAKKMMKKNLGEE